MITLDQITESAHDLSNLGLAGPFVLYVTPAVARESGLTHGQRIELRESCLTVMINALNDDKHVRPSMKGMFH